MPTDYRIVAGDKLKVTVFDEPNLTGEYMIGMDGQLDLPLVGSVNARNMQNTALATEISTKLKEGGYVLSPRVSVEVLSHRPVYVLGEVNKPGEYPHDSTMSLEQAIAKAGGYTRRADRKYIVLKRSGWSDSRRIELTGPVLQIAPGDTITVKESFF